MAALPSTCIRVMVSISIYWTIICCSTTLELEFDTKLMHPSGSVSELVIVTNNLERMKIQLIKYCVELGSDID